MKSYPLVAHWLDGEPHRRAVAVMAKIEDRHRTFVVDGAPVATGCPRRRRLVGVHEPVGRSRHLDRHDPRRRPARPAAPTGRRRPGGAGAARGTRPRSTRSSPRTAARCTSTAIASAEIEAQIAGVPYEPDDPVWDLGECLVAGAGADPDLLRGVLRDRVACWPPARRSSPSRAMVDKAHRASAGRCASEPRARTEPRQQLAGRRWSMSATMRIDNDGVGIECDRRGRRRPGRAAARLARLGRPVAPPGPALADAGFRVIVPDLRGFGASDAPEEVEHYALPFLAGDVLAVLDHARHRARPTSSATTGARRWRGRSARWRPTGSTTSSRCRSGTPSSFAGAGLAQREKSWYMLLFQFAGVAEQWLSNDDWANFRDVGAAIPTSTR